MSEQSSKRTETAVCQNCGGTVHLEVEFCYGSINIYGYGSINIYAECNDCNRAGKRPVEAGR